MNRKQNVKVRDGAIHHVPYARGHQPKCVNVIDAKTGKTCNHPVSLHGKGGDRCRAMGCHCTKLVLEDESEPEVLCV
jgi:hypothetical protein